MSAVHKTEAEKLQASERGSLLELAVVFLRLGTAAVGGPAAHIAIMEDEFVCRHRRITRRSSSICSVPLT